LWVIGESTEAEVERVIDAWLASLTRLVEEEGPGRFRAARVASTGMNAAAVGTILALFAATGGISGAEVGVAAGAAAAQQAALEQILGRAAARTLSGSARDGLLGSIGQIFDSEADRYRRILEAASDPLARAGPSEEAAGAVERESEAFHAQWLDRGGRRLRPGPGGDGRHHRPGAPRPDCRDRGAGEEAGRVSGRHVGGGRRRRH